MTKEEWVKKAEELFKSKAGCDDAFAKECAELLVKNIAEWDETIDTITPEEAVDEELSYWCD